MRRLLAFVLSLLLLISMVPSVRAEGDMAGAVKSFQPFKLDGESVEIGGYLINQNNYYKLRDLAAILSGTKSQFNVTFNKEKKQIELELGKPYEKLDTDLQAMKHDKIEAKMLTNNILVDGEEVMLNAALIDQNNYVKLRDLANVVRFFVGYDKETRDILVDTGLGLEEGSEEKVEEKTEDKKADKADGKTFYERYGQSIKEINASQEEIAAYLKGDKDKTLQLEKIEMGGKNFYKFSAEGMEVLLEEKTFNYDFAKDRFKRVFKQTEALMNDERVTNGTGLSVTPDFPANGGSIYFVKKDRIKNTPLYLNCIFDDIKFSLDGKDLVSGYSNGLFGVEVNSDFLAKEDYFKNYPEEQYISSVIGLFQVNGVRLMDDSYVNMDKENLLVASKEELAETNVMMFVADSGAAKVFAFIVFI